MMIFRLLDVCAPRFAAVIGKRDGSIAKLQEAPFEEMIPDTSELLVRQPHDTVRFYNVYLFRNNTCAGNC